MKNHKGTLFALLAACVSGVSIFYNKLVIIKGIDPLVFNIYKNGGVALIITLILLFTNRHIFQTITRKSWRNLALIGLIGGSIPFWMFFQGLKGVSALEATMIQKTLFLFVAVLAGIFLKEKLSLIQLVGYGLLFASNFILSPIGKMSLHTPELLILGATILWSLEYIVAKKTLATVPSSLAAWGRMTFGFVILLFIALVTGKSALLTSTSMNSLFPILGSITLLSLYVLSLYKALSLAPATLVTCILILSTVITNVLSNLVLNQPLAQPQILISLASIAGVSLTVFFARSRKDLRHEQTS